MNYTENQQRLVDYRFSICKQCPHFVTEKGVQRCLILRQKGLAGMLKHPRHGLGNYKASCPDRENRRWNFIITELCRDLEETFGLLSRELAVAVCIKPMTDKLKLQIASYYFRKSGTRRSVIMKFLDDRSEPFRQRSLASNDHPSGFAEFNPASRGRS